MRCDASVIFSRFTGANLRLPDFAALGKGYWTRPSQAVERAASTCDATGDCTVLVLLGGTRTCIVFSSSLITARAASCLYALVCVAAGNIAANLPRKYPLGEAHTSTESKSARARRLSPSSSATIVHKHVSMLAVRVSEDGLLPTSRGCVAVQAVTGAMMLHPP